MEKKVFTDESLATFVDEIKTYTDEAVSNKADTSHGNHVPTTQTANNKIFLRNDNTWATVTPANIGAAEVSHGTHVTFVSATPEMNGTASTGSSSAVSRADHVHPTDTSRAAATHNHSASEITSGTLSSDRLSTVPITKGGTNATSANGALTNFGLTATSSSNADIKVNSITIGDGVISYDATAGALKITFN